MHQVFSHSIADNRMQTRIARPSVMAIGGSIEYERVAGKLCSIDPIIMQEVDYLKNMIARIAARQPSLIVVERCVARVAMKFLRHAGITVVCNVKPCVLERIARCTQADVMPSVDGQILQPKVVGSGCGM